MRSSPTALCILFAIGAAGGLVGDAAHVEAGVTVYLDDSVPFVWNSALWFPALVGLATAAIGELRLWLGAARTALGPRAAVAAVAAVLAIYATTALVGDLPQGPATTLIAMLAVLVACWLADGVATLLCGVLAAVVGPLAEIAIVELELASYSAPSDTLFGVALWLPALYLAYGVVVARLAESLAAPQAASARTRAGSSSPA